MTNPTPTPLNENQDSITLEAARTMICEWRANRGGPATPAQPDSLFIPLADIQNVIALSTLYGGTGVRAYFGISTNPEELHLLLVPCYNGDLDLVEKIPGTQNSTIYDLIKPCPPLCKDLKSPLQDFSCTDQ